MDLNVQEYAAILRRELIRAVNDYDDVWYGDTLEELTEISIYLSESDQIELGLFIVRLAESYQQLIESTTVDFGIWDADDEEWEEED